MYKRLNKPAWEGGFSYPTISRDICKSAPQLPSIKMIHCPLPFFAFIKMLMLLHLCSLSPFSYVKALVPLHFPPFHHLLPFRVKSSTPLDFTWRMTSSEFSNSRHKASLWGREGLTTSLRQREHLSTTTEDLYAAKEDLPWWWRTFSRKTKYPPIGLGKVLCIHYSIIIIIIIILLACLIIFLDRVNK